MKNDMKKFLFTGVLVAGVVLAAFLGGCEPETRVIKNAPPPKRQAFQAQVSDNPNIPPQVRKHIPGGGGGN